MADFEDWCKQVLNKEFKEVNDIPDIPQCSEEETENILIPSLIKCGAIPKKDLIIGKAYIGSCRNASEGIWNGEEFEIKRYKWGMWEDDTVDHFETFTQHDIFIPIKIKNIE